MKYVALLVCIIASIGTAGAQSGSITGRVTDKQTAFAIKGSRVIVIYSQTASGKSVKCDSKGNYILPDLSLGTYTLCFNAGGYKSDTIRGVIVDADKVTFLNDELHSLASH
ncbi:MAG: carboxypeptidase regulatory-like domain-containing protein [Bacteroidetes bacterium]|nr:carboxypeptidase regulatory-like domain-containing protein [Bacteroidota bacterium]